MESALRLHDAVNREVCEADRSLAREALARPEVRLLMTVPGIGTIVALSVVCVIGDVERFPSGRHAVDLSRARPAGAPDGRAFGADQAPSRRGQGTPAAS
jgi:transposase